MPATQEVTCKCGKVFTARVADVRRGWAKSCSKSCAKTGNRNARRTANTAPRPGVHFCRECGDERSIGSDGLCDHCAYMREPQMGWDDHKH